MKLPRDANGQQVVKALCRNWGYRVVNQVGSHVILQTDTPFPHRLSVPDHNPVRTGTLNAIVRDVARHKGVDRQKILETF
jgi:predicted RNA binding protein YcfA (HicA-like mRNA interferase family)